ncbi:MAG: DUF1553 domain-containing protein [Planctomycetales bacterium]|nr:DUF1553 domain-containing protein [Planctomycetales bacterium]
MIHYRIALVSCLLLVGSLVRSEEPKIDFGTQIAPVLRQHCVRCHSAENSKGDISLATIDDLMSNKYVVAGDPNGSYLMELVTASDGNPPAMPKDSPPLSQGDVALLEQWIRQGAIWPGEIVVKERSKADMSWWALQPLQGEHGGVANRRTIDDFVQEKLVEQGLKSSPRADRRTLIRRLSFDLHGLPPSPDAVEAFVNDPDAMAYEKLVDQMLSSPNYGERFAQHWLDVAHYADTHGFERDMRRDNAWRYRDYVIESFNEDKPYNRFLQEQIAGDVLWPDDEQAVIATGFLAAGPWDYVGQVETKSDVLRRASRSLDLDDMATQVLTATIAMTINCARCHDHKLDPISQQEYYKLRAVFAGVKRADRTVSDTKLKQYEDDKRSIRDQLNAIDFEIGRLEGRGIDLADVVGGGNGTQNGTYRNGIDARTAKVQTRDFGKLGNVQTNHYSPSPFDFVDGVFIPDGENGTAKIPVSSTGITITGLPTTSGDAWDMIRNGPVASQHSPEIDGIDFTKDGHTLLGLHANAGITFDVGAIRQATGVAVMRLTAKVGYFGASGGNRADAWVFIDGRKVTEFPALGRDDGLQTIDLELPESSRFLTFVATDGGNGFSMDQIGFGDPKLKPASPTELSSDDRAGLDRFRQQRRELDARLEALGPPPNFYGVVSESDPQEIRVLTRGDPESPTGDALAPSALGALAMLDPQLGTAESNEGQRRVALARWITHPDNPLTRRVIVNRLWHWHFGKGLVDTPSDFGFGGGRPSHPELLDWLAAELDRQNWSLKAMHRLIVNSETYKQKSVGVTEQQSNRIDADNRLLWRQNPRRIDAESTRDAVLFVSGKLNAIRGGVAFEDFNYQDAYAPIYTYVTADDPKRWRRSVYRYIVRTTPNRFLTTLDCPDPANMTPNRLATTTPLQSLALYNNDFMLRQARYFAERLANEGGSDVAVQTTLAFGLAFGRKPTAEEAGLAEDLINRQGLFALCRSLFNSNEFVYVD